MNYVFSTYNNIKANYPELNRVDILDIVLPKEARGNFSSFEKEGRAIIKQLVKSGDKLIALEKRLETEKKLKSSEIRKLKNEIKKLEK